MAVKLGVSMSLAVFLLVACDRPGNPTPPRWIAKSPNGAQLYLIGTFHALPEAIRVPADVERTMEHCGRLIVEATKPSAEEAAQLRSMMVASQENSAMRIDETLASEMSSAAHSLGLRSENLANLKVWAAALTITSAAIAEAGYRSDWGLDAILLDQARKSKVKTIGLETITDQLEIFNALSQSNQIEFLREHVSGVMDGGTGARMRAFYDAWRMGKEEEFLRLHKESVRRAPTIESLDQRLLDERNAVWAKTLANTLPAGDCAVVAVGIMHFAGDRSLLRLLEAEGMKTRRVNDWESAS